MTHPSVEHFARAMQFKGLAPCPQDGRWEIPTDSDICTEVETIALVFGFVRALRPRLVVETGCNMGCVTKAILFALQANDPHATEPVSAVCTCDVDINCVNVVRLLADQHVKVGGGTNLYCFQGTGLEVLQRHPGADLYWIDSSDESRMAELHWLREHGKKGAVVLTHDTNLIGHVTEVHRTLPNWVLLPGPRGLGIATL